jgi:hypothetical protein
MAVKPGISLIAVTAGTAALAEAAETGALKS